MHLPLSPVDIKPDYEIFPIIGNLQRWAGGVMGAALVIIVILLVVAAVLWGASRLGGSQRGQQVGAGAFLVLFIAGLIVGFAGGFTEFAQRTGAEVTWDSAPVSVTLDHDAA